MTHNEKRADWMKEGIIGFSIGVIYGVTVTATSHVNKKNKFNLFILRKK